MRHADQLYEGGVGRDGAFVSRAVEHVAGDGGCSGGELALGTGADDRIHGVAALDQDGDEAAAHIAGAAGDED